MVLHEKYSHSKAGGKIEIKQAVTTAVDCPCGLTTNLP